MTLPTRPGRQRGIISASIPIPPPLRARPRRGQCEIDRHDLHPPSALTGNNWPWYRSLMRFVARRAHKSDRCALSVPPALISSSSTSAFFPSSLRPLEHATPHDDSHLLAWVLSLRHGHHLVHQKLWVAELHTSRQFTGSSPACTSGIFESSGHRA